MKKHFRAVNTYFVATAKLTDSIIDNGIMASKKILNQSLLLGERL